MSRTAVNSSCKVRSPLSGFVTTAVVLVSIYELTGALYWIPKATLAAIVITAIWPLIGTWRTYYHYWRTSLTDFIGSMIAFWVSLFVSTEIGIGSAVAWMIVQSLLRQAFSRVTQIGSDTSSELHRSIDDSRGMPADIPSDTRIFRMNQSMFFPNAQKTKQQILDAIQTHHSSQHNSMYGSETERTWSVVSEKRMRRLRKDAGVHDAADLPPIRVVILDFIKVNHFDVTACVKLREFLTELRKYAGESVEVRFVGVAKHVRDRFDRARPSWRLVDATEAGSESSSDENDDKSEEIKVYRTIREAVSAIRYADVERVMEEKMKADHVEDV
jgi:sodium-independent sulfate anion transporter 11